MAKKTVYTLWRDPYWVNVVEFTSEPFTSDRVRSDAVENGEILARARGAAHVLLRKDGAVEWYRPAPGAFSSVGRERRRAS